MARDMSAVILDPGPLDQLRALARPGRPSVIPRFLDSYLASVPDEVLRLQRAISQADYCTCRNLAHGLKSAAGSVGAQELSALCGRIERLARDRDEASLRATLSDLQRIHERTVKAVETLLGHERSGDDGK